MCDASCTAALQPNDAVDLVVFWTNTSSPAYVKQWDTIKPPGSDLSQEAMELRWAMRSWAKHGLLERVRKVFVVHNADEGAPSWFSPAENFEAVSLEAVAAEAGAKGPSRNRNARASLAHHVPGAADWIVLMPDDLLLGKKLDFRDLYDGSAELIKTHLPATVEEADTTPHARAARKSHTMLDDLFGPAQRRAAGPRPSPVLIRRCIAEALESRFGDALASTRKDMSHTEGAENVQYETLYGNYAAACEMAENDDSFPARVAGFHAGAGEEEEGESDRDDAGPALDPSQVQEQLDEQSRDPAPYIRLMDLSARIPGKSGGKNGKNGDSEARERARKQQGGWASARQGIEDWLAQEFSERGPCEKKVVPGSRRVEKIADVVRENLRRAASGSDMPTGGSGSGSGSGSNMPTGGAFATPEQYQKMGEMASALQHRVTEARTARAARRQAVLQVFLPGGSGSGSGPVAAGSGSEDPLSTLNPEEEEEVAKVLKTDGVLPAES